MHKGGCFCGAVQIEVSGEPESMGYCHCQSCRSWSGGPVNAFTLWRPEAVHVKAGAKHIGMFQKTAASQRQYCTKCGGHLMTNHPPLELIDVFASTAPSLSFRPALHVNHAETVLPMRDGLPKFKDFPQRSADQASRCLNRTAAKLRSSPTHGLLQEVNQLSAHTTKTTDLPYLCGIGNRRRCSSLLGLHGRADAAGIPDWRVPAPTGCLSGSRLR
jgi:hypothetical protein